MSLQDLQKKYGAPKRTGGISSLDAKYGNKPDPYTDPYGHIQARVSEPPKSPINSFLSAGNSISNFLGIKKFGQGIASGIRTLAPQGFEKNSGNPNGRDSSIGGINQTGDEAGQALRDTSKIAQELHKLVDAGVPKDDPRRVKLANALRQSQGQMPITQEEIDPGTKLTAKEVVGSAGNVAANILTPGAFKGSLPAKVLKNTAVGAGYGLAGGLNDNKDLGGIAKSTGLGAGIGAAIPGIGALAGKIKKVITGTVPEALMNHAVKPTLNELKKNIKYGTDTLGKELLQEGVAGSPKKLLTISESKLNSLEDELQSHLKNSKGVITIDDLRPYFKETIDKLNLTPGSKDAAEAVETLLADVPQTMDLKTANVMKRNLYNRLRDVAYKLDPNLSDKAQTMKSLARALKLEIESKSDNPALVEGLNKKLSTYGRLEDRVVDILARDNRNKILSLTDTIAGAAGFLNPLAWLGLLVKKGLESETALTNTAKVLNKAKNVGTGKVATGVKEVGKRALLNIP